MPSRNVLRDIHPKANACVKANVTVVPNLPPDLKIGFLDGKPNGDMTYKAWIVSPTPPTR